MRLFRILTYTFERTMRQFGLDLTDFKSGIGDSASLLYGLVRSMKPEVVIEIGSARGRSACFIGTALAENRKGTLYAIDPHLETDWNDHESVHTYEILMRNLKLLRLSKYVKVLRSKSEDAANGWTLPIDILFIDGDHSYEGVKRDWESFSPFVSPRGVIIFHDTMWDIEHDKRGRRTDMGVPRFVEELRAEGYPVVTISQDYGTSIVQPVRGGLQLSAPESVSV